MGALEYFKSRSIRIELHEQNDVRAIGPLNDAMRTAIRNQKTRLIHELQWREFESLLAIVGPRYQTLEHEYAEIREVARKDVQGAISAFRRLADGT